MINSLLPKKINILVVAKDVDGGTGTYILDLLKIKKKYDNIKFNLRVSVLEKPAYRMPKKFQATFFSGKNSYPKHYQLTLGNITRFYSELVWTRRVIFDFKPQIILSIDIHSNLLAILSKVIWFRNVKLIATTHINLLETLSNKSSGFVRFLLINAIKIFYEQADILIGVSKGVSRNLRKDFHLHKNVTTIYNGIESYPAIIKPKFRRTNKIIITVTRLDDQKDVKNLVRAFYLLQKKFSEVKLWILGDGPKRNELELLVMKYKLQEKVHFFGWINNIRKYLLKSSLFALSSKREGLPYAPLEAMKFGLPIVSTDAPYGPKEILDNGKYGVLIPVGRPDIMQKTMYDLLTNRQRYNYFSKKSIERSLFFSVDKMLNEYRKVFINLCQI